MELVVTHGFSFIILDQCAIKQFHKLDGMDRQWADAFGLNHAQMRYGQDAIPGNEAQGYAQALLGVDGEWRGIENRALDTEQQVLEFDPKAQSVDEIPGLSASDRSKSSVYADGAGDADSTECE